ncbi:MAG: hypothetical protein WC378_02560 [Opitutaceae bacterium]|jgi:hypothetical protein
MSEQRALKGRAILSAIRRVLYREWDPLEICDVESEAVYDPYVANVYRLLASKVPREKLIVELKHMQVELIGADFQKEKKLHLIADSLMAINVSLDT